ncbi:MAG: phosphatidylserine/phosphatidylglycerophosphate/cardiolipin synthase family protein, partial [Candidatus Sericytochromatia bacterium]|nr:phosphatidylserine/phosphatidylglycerophosphate/cardiolipin synthase family protein [Candidatus Tanganyikabacteria bacterium]
MASSFRRVMLVFAAAVLTACGQPAGAPLAGTAAAQKARALSVERAAAIDRAVAPHTALKATKDNEARLLVDGAEGFGAIRDLILGAKKSLWFETFIWHNDQTGVKVAQLLRQRALEGLDVRVLIDMAGSRNREDDKHVLRILQDYQVPVRYFNPYITKGANFHISHRKLYMADGYRAITGGMNIGAEYETEWHDLLVEVRGSAARQMHQGFIDGWNNSNDGPPEQLVIPDPPATPTSGTVTARLALTSLPPRKPRREEIKHAHFAAIRAAQKRIRMFPIYLSDPDYVEELAKAARRGVEIQLLIPTKNDFESFRYINRHYAGRLLDAGATVKVYDKLFSHVKYLSI